MSFVTDLMQSCPLLGYSRLVAPYTIPEWNQTEGGGVREGLLSDIPAV